MTDHNYVNKKFNTILPLTKATTESDGYYYLEFGLSTDTPDLEGDRVTEECLDDMIQQAKSLNSFQVHQYGLNDIIGPITDSWKTVKDGVRMMMIKVRVRPSMKDQIKELVDTGVRLGGSIGGIYQRDSVKDGVRELEQVKLLEGSLTPLPVNWDTLGTATGSKSCPGGLCKQIIKSIESKYFTSTNETNPKSVGGDDANKHKNKELEEHNMEEKEFQTFKDEMLQAQKEQNQELIDAIKALKPEEKDEPEFNEDELVAKTVAGVLKALGVPAEEDPVEPAPEDVIAKAITKAILIQGEKREGTRKSNPLGGDKFEGLNPVDKKEAPEGKMTTRKAAESLAAKKGLA